MKRRHEAYFNALRTRHAQDRAQLRRALAGRCPDYLRDLAQRHRAVERETGKILRAIQ